MKQRGMKRVQAHTPQSAGTPPRFTTQTTEQQPCPGGRVIQTPTSPLQVLSVNRDVSDSSHRHLSLCMWLKWVVLCMRSHQERSPQGGATEWGWSNQVNRALVEPKQSKKVKIHPSQCGSQTPQHFTQRRFTTSSTDLQELTLPKYCWPDFNNVWTQCTIKPSASNNMDKCRPKSAYFKLKHTHRHSQCPRVQNQ